MNSASRSKKKEEERQPILSAHVAEKLIQLAGVQARARTFRPQSTPQQPAPFPADYCRHKGKRLTGGDAGGASMRLVWRGRGPRDLHTLRARGGRGAPDHETQSGRVCVLRPGSGRHRPGPADHPRLRPLTRRCRPRPGLPTPRPRRPLRPDPGVRRQSPRPTPPHPTVLRNTALSTRPTGPPAPPLTTYPSPSVCRTARAPLAPSSSGWSSRVSQPSC